MYSPTLVYPPARWSGLGCADAKADKFILVVSRESAAHGYQTLLPQRAHYNRMNFSSYHAPKADAFASGGSRPPTRLLERYQGGFLVSNVR